MVSAIEMVPAIVHLSTGGLENSVKYQDAQDTHKHLKNVVTMVCVTANYIYATVKLDGLDQLVISRIVQENQTVIIEE